MTDKADVAESTELVAPSEVGFWDTTVGKAARTAIYLAISAAIGALLADIANNPTMFGIYTPIINVVLVTLKNLANPNVKNI